MAYPKRKQSRTRAWIRWLETYHQSISKDPLDKHLALGFKTLIDYARQLYDILRRDREKEGVVVMATFADKCAC